MFKWLKKSSPAVTDWRKQLEILGECGIAPNEGVTEEQITSIFSEADFSVKPFVNLLCALGGPPDDEEVEFLSDDVWHFDTEWVEDEGVYEQIARRISQMAKGDLPLEDVKDWIDFDEESGAWLEITVDGQTHHWDLEFSDDWVDPNVFEHIALVMKNRGAKRALCTCDPAGGQDVLLACLLPEQIKCLKEKTGTIFQPIVA